MKETGNEKDDVILPVETKEERTLANQGENLIEGEYLIEESEAESNDAPECGESPLLADELEMIALLRRLREENADTAAIFRDYAGGEFRNDDSVYRLRAALFINTIEGYRAGSGVQPEKMEEALRKVVDNFCRCASGHFHISMVEDALKALDYDRVVKEGKLRQKNPDTVRNPEVKKSDGIPHLRQSGKMSKEKTTSSIFDLAGKAR